ncbi:anti-sigma factor family protein [Streptomyces sp. NPDC004752]
MASDVTCQKLREIGAELALGVLPGRERADAVAHLDRCAECRKYVEELTSVSDRLIGLLPGSEPPVGFEERVARRLTTAARERRPPMRAAAAFPGGRRRIRVRLAAVAATLVLAVGFGGWAVGTAIEDVVVGSAPTAGTNGGMLSGDLSSVVAHGKTVGEIYAHPGRPGWIYMAVDLAGAGAPRDGKVTCLLVHKDGSTVRVGTFALKHDGTGYWGSPAMIDPGKVSGAQLTSTDGTVLATAHVTAGDQS